MLWQVVDETTDPGYIHPELAAHQADMIARCPYLGPSVEQGLTVWSAYRVDGPADKPALLAMLVEHAEKLRRERRKHGVLVCRNIGLLGPADLPAARRLMDWPSWIARNLYAPVQMMVGRFWIGLERDDSRGVPMMPPPVSFFTMRHSIARKDGLFLAAKVPDIMAILEQGPGDDGRDVLREALGRPVDDPASAYWDLRNRFPLPATNSTAV